MSTPNATPAGDPGDIPAALVRTTPAVEALKDATTATPAAATETPPAPKLTKAQRKAAKRMAKEVIAKTTGKPKPKHKPSDIVRTDANPAKSIVPVRFKQKYAQHNGSCGDEVAYAIKSFLETKNDDGRTVLSMAKLEQLATDNGIDFSAYKGLNNGQKSMNVRNKLRGLLKAGKKIKVGGRTFADAAKALKVRDVETDDAGEQAEA